MTVEELHRLVRDNCPPDMPTVEDVPGTDLCKVVGTNGTLYMNRATFNRHMEAENKEFQVKSPDFPPPPEAPKAPEDRAIKEGGPVQAPPKPQIRVLMMGLPKTGVVAAIKACKRLDPSLIVSPIGAPTDKGGIRTLLNEYDIIHCLPICFNIQATALAASDWLKADPKNRRIVVIQTGRHPNKWVRGMERLCRRKNMRDLMPLSLQHLMSPENTLGAVPIARMTKFYNDHVRAVKTVMTGPFYFVRINSDQFLHGGDTSDVAPMMYKQLMSAMGIQGVVTETHWPDSNSLLTPLGNWLLKSPIKPIADLGLRLL